MAFNFIGTWKNDIKKIIFTISNGIFLQSYYDNPNLIFFKGTWVYNGDNKIILTYTHESKDGVTSLENMSLVKKEYTKWIIETLSSNTIKIIPEGYENAYNDSETEVLDIYTKE